MKNHSTLATLAVASMAMGAIAAAPHTPPSIGRRVHFRLNGSTTGGVSNYDSHLPVAEQQPMDAGIAYVWPKNPGSLQYVNISVADHAGKVHGLTSVPFRQPSDPIPVGFYVEWMPYQNNKHASESMGAGQFAGNAIQVTADGRGLGHVETKTYGDGTTATGLAPLPATSPVSVDLASTAPLGKGAACGDEVCESCQ